MFFQWVLCSAIFITGLTLNFVLSLTEEGAHFYPLGLLGGFLWATGNLLVVPVISCIGLGLGMCIWGSTSLVFALFLFVYCICANIARQIMGWASGRFGLFGLTPQVVANPLLNYLGVAMCLVSTVLFVAVKPTENQYEPIEEKAPPSTFVDRLGRMRRVAGVVLALLSGVLYGVNFDPSQYLIDHHLGTSNGLDYAFSQFCGIFATSTVYMLVYAAIKRNRPDINPQLVLPGFASGVAWAIAQICFSIANTKLGLVIAFPLVGAGPGMVAAAWGVFLFREIRGRRNFILLLAAFACLVAATVLIAFSLRV